MQMRFKIEYGQAVCCGLPAPISGFGDQFFSSFTYTTTYTVRKYEVEDFPEFTEEPCERTRSRTGDEYAAVGEEGITPTCTPSEFEDDGCEEIYGVLPSCNNITPQPGTECISNTVDDVVTSSPVDCEDEAVSAQAQEAAGVVVDFDDNPWEDVLTMAGGTTYGGGFYIKISYEIRKLGYPIPVWIVLTIEVDDGVGEPTYEEDTIFLGWGETYITYDIAPSYGLSKTIVDVKVYYAPQKPPET
jgi:hypothetical protein